jgi:hypothetical protein
VFGQNLTAAELQQPQPSTSTDNEQFQQSRPKRQISNAQRENDEEDIFLLTPVVKFN